MKVEKLLAIYAFAFIIVIIFSAYFPLESSIFLETLLPVDFDFLSSSLVRYRMSLFVVGSIIFAFFVPVVGLIGFYGADPERIKKLHWGYVVFGIPIVFILWLGYPSVALCGNCWASNDMFYFFLTLFNFLALQVSVQGIYLKIKIFVKGLVK
jgi:hypothetical protein